MAEVDATVFLSAREIFHVTISVSLLNQKSLRMADPNADINVLELFNGDFAAMTNAYPSNTP